jgi:hypothetical protein
LLFYRHSPDIENEVTDVSLVPALGGFSRFFSLIQGRVLAPSGLVALAILLAPGLVRGEDPSSPELELYGFFRVDAIYDDSRMQNHQYAFWALSEDARLAPDDQPNLTIHPRVTKLGLRLKPTALSKTITARGVLEVDFQNGGSESRQILRMRVAMFELRRANLSFSGGQNWDVISPLYPTVHLDGILWNAGNLGDRHPQLRAAWRSDLGRGSVNGALALGQTGAVDSKDLDGNRRLDGSEGALPFLQARIGFDHTVGGRPIQIGVWGHRAREKVETPLAGEKESVQWSAGFDALFGITERIQLKGEGWCGENLSDVRGGIGQGVNTLTGREIRATGGWVEIGGRLRERWGVWIGYSIDDPDDDDVPSRQDVEAADEDLSIVGRTRNQVAYVSNRFTPFDPFLIGLEYCHWVTEYHGLEKGTDNRITLYFSYSF